ncbi:MAG: GIY-YIG nuclease family protein, partial [Campylobacterota bacterium]|nr:GIY-YIG nuclease family protein [Campylobacterota bacterium]
MDNFTLDEILDNDPLGLLPTLKVKNPVVTPDDRLVSKFEEINKFFKDNGYEPKKSHDINEMTLSSRLKGIRKDKYKVDKLKQYDTYNLLETKEVVKFDTIDDILNNDTLGIFEDKEEDIFTLKNVPKIDKARAEADFVAKRKKCENFEEYEELFVQCQKDLKDGKRKLVKFNEQYYENGAFFVLKGVLVYLEKIEKKQKDKYNKLDARTKIIFENGTKSNMYLRSLGKGLYEDGYFVSKHEDTILDDLTQIN